MTPTDAWEDGDLGHPHVIKDGATYKMWYAPNDHSVGYATSADGIAWTKHSGNPILEGAAGEWDENIGAPFVIKVGPSDYRMWYVAKAWPDPNAFGYATSTDGIAWTRRPTPVLTIGADGAWDDTTIWDPNVLYAGGQFKMWYCGEDGDAPRIGTATSPDGITWTKYAGNPVLAGGAPGSWEEDGRAVKPTCISTALCTACGTRANRATALGIGSGAMPPRRMASFGPSTTATRC